MHVFYQVILTLLVGCARDGKAPVPALVEKAENPSVTNAGPQEIRGTVPIDLPSSKSWSIWIIDHTTPKLSRLPLDAAGKLTIPLNLFADDRVYSMHLVEDYTWFGTFNFGDDNQRSTFIKYHGGYGFDLGEIKLPEKKFDRRNPLEGKINVQIGGGFAIESLDEDLGFLKFAPLTGLLSFDYGMSLRVSSPIDLFYSFFHPPTYPIRYSDDFNRYTHLNIKILTDPNASPKSITLVDSDESTRKSTTLTESLETPRIFWRELGFSLEKSASSYSRRFYFGKVPPLWTTVVLRLVPEQGEIRFFPLTLRDYVKMPPSIVNIWYSQVGATPPIDYTDQNTENGLTKAFCIKPDVIIKIAPPTVVTTRTTSLFDTVDINLTYFVEENLKLTQLPPNIADFGDGFGTELAISSSVTWHPSTSKLSIKLPESTLDSTVLSIPNEIMLASMQNKPVQEIRLEVLFRSNSLASEASGIFRFVHNCTK